MIVTLQPPTEAAEFATQSGLSPNYCEALTLAETLQSYVYVYYHHLPQRVLGQVCPLEAIEQWHQTHPELFISEVKISRFLTPSRSAQVVITGRWAWCLAGGQAVDKQVASTMGIATASPTLGRTCANRIRHGTNYRGHRER